MLGADARCRPAYQRAEIEIDDRDAADDQRYPDKHAIERLLTHHCKDIIGQPVGRVDALLAAFDAVICLGPFYHLPEHDDRERAASELVRVLRPGASPLSP